MSLQPNRHVTIVMYHFVRELKNSRYPDIKGLSIEEFRGQIKYIRRYYNIIGVTDLLAAIGSSENSLPQRAILLTFDDGYRDHFDNVLPVLSENGLTGCFFPPARAVMEGKVLDVNKIHFILASVSDKMDILTSLFELLEEAREEFGLDDPGDYRQRLAHPNRFDTAEVVLIKRLLQRELPEALRKKITETLFKKYVTQDESAFSRELYMSVDQLRTMVEAGMVVGSHSYDHYWLDTLDAREQERQIDLSLNFLQQLGIDTRNWVMCYPYGAFNNSLIQILRKKGCKAGFTTEVYIGNLDTDSFLTLPRIDTNDLPKQGDAAPNEWTQKVFY